MEEESVSSKNNGRIYLWAAAVFLPGWSLLSGRSETGMLSVSPFSYDSGGILTVSGVVEDIGRTHSGKQALEMAVMSVGECSVPAGCQEKTILYMGDAGLPVLPGDTVTAEIFCRRVENFTEEFDYVRYMAGRGIRYTCFLRGGVQVISGADLPFRLRISRWRSILISTLRWRLSPLKDENSALLTAFLAGDRNSVREDTLEDFRRSGMMHALALSGMHVGIIYSFLSFLFSVLGGFPVSKKIRSVAVMCCLWPYALLTGMGTSIFRAVVMATVYETAVLLEREKSTSGALTLSAIIIILADPRAPASISFQLSFGAMLGIAVCYRNLSAFVRTEELHREVASVENVLGKGALPVRRGVPVTDWVRRPVSRYVTVLRIKFVLGKIWSRMKRVVRRRIVKPVWNLFALSFSCQLVTVPVIMANFGTYAHWSLIANIICSPLIGASMMMAPVCLLLGDASPVGSFCFDVLDFLLDALRFSVEVMGRG